MRFIPFLTIQEYHHNPAIETKITTIIKMNEYNHSPISPPHQHSPSKKNAYTHSPIRPHHRSPIQRRKAKLFAEKLSMIQPGDHAVIKEAVFPNCSPEKVGNRFLAVPTAVQEHHQPQKSSSMTTTQRALLVETLEAKLVANVMKCTELRRLVEARKRGIQVSLPALKLGSKQEHGSSLEGGKPLPLELAFEALVLVKEEECANMRKLLAEAKKWDTTSSSVSLSSHTKIPTSILRNHSSPKNTKSVTWGRAH
jgi:hypothetical protein